MPRQSRWRLFDLMGSGYKLVTRSIGYEGGEIWGHGGNKPRIVRVGTHQEGNFRSRIAEHFLLDKKKLGFDHRKSAPHDRSIFRKKSRG